MLSSDLHVESKTSSLP